MLLSARMLTGYTLNCRDGQIGRVKGFYFDDRHWTVRYLVAGTGEWLAERQVLISPYALGAVNPTTGDIVVDLRKQQIEDSPPLDSDRPVSRQFEDAYHGYYGWPRYWAGSNVWGAYPEIARSPAEWTAPLVHERPEDAHLRSTHDVRGHHVEATDGGIGHVEDFLIDDRTWTIRYLVVGTRNWWPGKRVLVSPEWIDRVSWPEAKVFVHVNRDRIQHAPEYTDKTPLTRAFEISLMEYYKSPAYETDDTTATPFAGGRGREA